MSIKILDSEIYNQSDCSKIRLILDGKVYFKISDAKANLEKLASVNIKSSLWVCDPLPRRIATII